MTLFQNSTKTVIWMDETALHCPRFKQEPITSCVWIHLMNQSVLCTSPQILSHVPASVSCSSSFLSKRSWRLKHVAALCLDDSDSTGTSFGASVKELSLAAPRFSSSGQFLINPNFLNLTSWKTEGSSFLGKTIQGITRAPWTYGQAGQAWKHAKLVGTHSHKPIKRLFRTSAQHLLWVPCKSGETPGIPAWCGMGMSLPFWETISSVEAPAEKLLPWELNGHRVAQCDYNSSMVWYMLMIVYLSMHVHGECIACERKVPEVGSFATQFACNA